MPPEVIILLVVAVLFLVSTIFMVFACLKRCPPNKIIVIYGNVGKDKNGQPVTARCVHGGTVFIMPLLQSYKFLDLTPMRFDIHIQNSPIKDDSYADIDCTCKVAVSTEPELMMNAAQRLLGLPQQEIKELAEDIMTGQLRSAAAEADSETLRRKQDDFLNAAMKKIENAYRLLGLRTIQLSIQNVKIKK